MIYKGQFMLIVDKRRSTLVDLSAQIIGKRRNSLAEQVPARARSDLSTNDGLLQ